MPQMSTHTLGRACANMTPHCFVAAAAQGEVPPGGLQHGAAPALDVQGALAARARASRAALPELPHHLPVLPARFPLCGH